MNRPLEKRLGERGSQKKVMQGKTTRKKSRKQEGRQRKVMHLQKEILPKQWARKKIMQTESPHSSSPYLIISNGHPLLHTAVYCASESS